MSNFGLLDFCLLFLLLPLVSANVATTMVVNFGDTVEFVCNHSRSDLKYIKWSYEPHNKRGGKIDLYESENGGVVENYEASCRTDESVCRLKLLMADEKSAGTYSCTTLNGDFKVVNPVINLVVGGLNCLSNVGADGQMIGENDCKDVDPDVLNRTCIFEYHGILTQSPTLEWTRRYKNGKEIEEHFQLGHKKKFNVFSFNDIIKISSDINEVLFRCHAKELPNIKPCSLPTFNVINVKSNSSKIITADNAEDIKCSFSSSANVKCSCTWTHTFGTAELKIRGCSLPEIHRKQPGTYVCNVMCQLSADKYCNIESVNTVVVETKKEEHSSSDFLSKSIIIALLCFVSVILIFICFSVIYCIYNSKKKQNQRDQQYGKKTEAISPCVRSWSSANGLETRSTPKTETTTTGEPPWRSGNRSETRSLQLTESEYNCT